MKTLLILLLGVAAARAQLAVTGSPPQVTGDKTIMPLEMKNSFNQGVASSLAARGPNTLNFLTNAVAAAHEAVKQQPGSARAYKARGIALDRQGALGEGIMSLRAAAWLDPDDAETRFRLAQLHMQARQTFDAADQYRRGMELSPHDPYVSAARSVLSALNDGNVLSLPGEITATTLQETMSQKLDRDEARLVINPLGSTPELERWSQKLTADATNDMNKVSLLVRELSRKRRGPGNTNSPPRTASEGLRAFSNQDVYFICQDYTYLYIALARAAGIRTHFVDVLVQSDGATTPHVSAISNIDGQWLFVDPTWLTIGLPPRRWVVLDDVQTAAYYLSQQASLREVRIASKLSPEVPEVQLALFAALLFEDHLDEARAMLPAIQQMDPDKATAYRHEAELLIREGDGSGCINTIRKALDVQPDNGNSHMLLAEGLALEQRCDEARRSLRNALQFGLIQGGKDTANLCLADTNFLAAWGYFISGRSRCARSDFSHAIEDFTKAIDLYPTYVVAYLGRARSLQMMGGKSAVAMTDCNKAIQLAPNFGEAYAIRSRLKSIQGDQAGAAADQQRATELKGKTPD